MLAAMWCPRRERFRALEVRRFGTAIRSSNWFGGRGAAAGSRVQVRSTGETEAGTVFPAEQQAGGYRQSQLFPRDVPDVDMRRALQQRIGIGIVHCFRIGAEDGRIHGDVQFGANIGKASPALALHGTVEPAPPQVRPLARHLKLPRYGYRADQVQIQPLERGIVGLKLSHCPDRAPL
jgi:hypothetical protein